VDAVQFLLGSGSGYFYLFWGFFAIWYAIYLCSKPQRDRIVIALLLIIQLLWLGYFVVWTIPWRPYFILPGTVSAMFVAKLLDDLWSQLEADWVQNPASRHLPGNIIAIATLLLFSLYQFQNVLRRDVLDSVGVASPEFRKVPEFSATTDAAKYLQTHVGNGEVVDTWERELGLMTTITFHYPDQSLLIYSHSTVFRGAPNHYSLGRDYFDEFHPDYVVVGWWGRFTQIYDLQYLQENATQLITIGSKEWGYDIYRMGP
jgi:hypothetical protein